MNMNLDMGRQMIELESLPVEVAKPIWPNDNKFFLTHEQSYLGLIEPTIMRYLSA